MPQAAEVSVNYHKTIAMNSFVMLHIIDYDHQFKADCMVSNFLYEIVAL